MKNIFLAYKFIVSAAAIVLVFSSSCQSSLKKNESNERPEKKHGHKLTKNKTYQEVTENKTHQEVTENKAHQEVTENKTHQEVAAVPAENSYLEFIPATSDHKKSLDASIPKNLIIAAKKAICEAQHAANPEAGLASCTPGEFRLSLPAATPITFDRNQINDSPCLHTNEQNAPMRQTKRVFTGYDEHYKELTNIYIINRTKALARWLSSTATISPSLKAGPVKVEKIVAAGYSQVGMYLVSDALGKKYILKQDLNADELDNDVPTVSWTLS